MNRFFRLFAFSGFFAWLISGGAAAPPAHAQATTPVQNAPKKYDVRLWAARDVAPCPKIRLSINTRNVPTVAFAAYKVDAQQWLLSRDENARTPPAPLTPNKPAQTWTASADAPGRVQGHMSTSNTSTPYQNDVYRSRQINMPPLAPGVYLVVASGGGKEAWVVVNVTNLAVVLKRAPRRVLTWVTDHASGVPVVGARVRLWDRNQKRFVAGGTTRPDGVCVFAAAPSSRQVLLVERAFEPPRAFGDVAGLVVGNTSPDNKLVAHLQTDRPIYRPGNTVQFRAILRRTQNRGYVPESTMPVSVEVRDSRENVVERTQITTSAIGTLASFVELPSACAPGAYSIVLRTRDDQAAYFPFSVAEYRKPEFQVGVRPTQARYLAGEEATFVVQAAYYFGAPLPQAEVRYQVRRSPNPFYAAFGSDTDDAAAAQWFGGGDGNLYERDTYGAEPFVAEGTAYTDAQGQVKIVFKTKPDAPDSTYTITCTTIDAQRRQVESSGAMPVYAAARRIGMRTRVLAAALGSIVPVEIRLADLDNKPASGRVFLSTHHHVYDAKTGTYQTKTLEQTRVDVPRSGQAVANVPATAAGELEIVGTVSDPTGRKAQAFLPIWVAGPNDGPTETERTEPTVTIKTDKRTYAPGETAHVFLSTNTPTRPTLLTVEGGDFFAWTVSPKAAAHFTWNVPLTLAMSPNAHITGSQWARPAQLVSGSSILPVPDRTRRLEISVTPDKTVYRPGDKASYTIRTRDGLTGKPVAGAEVALSVVDSSIYALRPDTTADLYTLYWGLRQNQTETLVSAPEEVSGGAYQRNSPSGVAPVREKFLDTAYWNAHVVTDANGTATATVEMPGNLTSWRATALAVTGTTQVGRTVSTVSVSRPVMLRLAAPRQFVQGDLIEVIATIHNQTARRHVFAASLSAEGVAIQNTTQNGSAANTVSVPVGANSEVKQHWIIKVSDVPPSRLARLTGTLAVTDALLPGESPADFSDALRVSVPIVPRGVPERLVVGGTLGKQAETTLTLDLPQERLEPATVLAVRVTNGVEGAARDGERDVFAQSTPNSPSAAAAQLLLAATPGAAPPNPRVLRDALALLSRSQSQGGGWGYWDNVPPDAGITARVLLALEAVRRNPRTLPPNVPFPDALLSRGAVGARSLYAQTNLWEERALLAVALAHMSTATPADSALLDEVQTRGAQNLSPYATLLLADALGSTSTSKGRDLANTVLRAAIVGPTTVVVPAGDHPGWRASTMETTAQALRTLVHLKQDEVMQAKLARWLAHPTDGDEDIYYSADDRADAAYALRLYLTAQNSPASFANLAENEVVLAVNGTPVPFNKRAPGTETAPLVASVPNNLLKTGPNIITLRRTNGSGTVFVDADATIYKARADETDRGLRVLRRWETQNRWGTWEPLRADTLVHPSSPMRVTVVAWPSSDQPEALRITEPLPSGFELVDSDMASWGREEVRDGAIIHCLRAEGATPLTFRYYLRAEATGHLLALPATGEMLRRPSVRGSSDATPLTVAEGSNRP